MTLNQVLKIGIHIICLKKLMRRPIILVSLCLFTIILVFVHYSIQNSPSGGEQEAPDIANVNEPRYLSSTGLNFGRGNHWRENIASLHERIDHLAKIKLSLSNELRTIQRKKVQLVQDNNYLLSKNEQVLNSINRNKLLLRQLELDVSALRKRRSEDNCDIGRIAPILFKPMASEEYDDLVFVNLTRRKLPQLDQYKIAEYGTPQSHSLNISRCSLAKQFSFHLSMDSRNESVGISSGESVFKTGIDLLLNHRLHTSDVNRTCMIVKFLTSTKQLGNLDPTENYLLIDFQGLLQRDTLSRPNHSILASPFFHSQQYIDKLDIVIPSVIKPFFAFDSIVGSIPPSSPIGRKYLASYFGIRNENETTKRINQAERILQTIHRNSIDDLFLFLYDCDPNYKPDCYSQREKLTELSVFSILIAPTRSQESHHLHESLYLALSKGSVPVVLASRSTMNILPFNEVIDWTKASIILPLERLPEVHFIMRTMSAVDLYRYKYFGRHLFEKYLATSEQVMNAIISIVSLERLNYPPMPILNVETKLYRSSKQLTYDTDCLQSACIDNKSENSTASLTAELLGPREPPLASAKFRHNFTLALSGRYDLWNEPMFSPHELYPSLPLEAIAPSEHKFLSTDQAYRPIAEGLGGSGNEFSRALGGDFPNEQFSIVLLTYNRNDMLMKTLERLKSMPYLNKILVVWNGVENPPHEKLVWPDVGVPLELVRVERNSLNNRFIPYDGIETDAILSLDDDSPLRADEIVFAFRVWRQSRDQIVGFPGRYHAWDREKESWVYNSNHSCELSMVLTGGAFFHKYYSYQYTFKMAHSIREIVDRYMNCEDIAMNFLVAHLTRKPPIKVTSRWTFHCSGCANSLSEDDSHFTERHECLNLFTSIYGYMPLMSTQHRADSVLFKTRLPSDKQKCFKYV